MKSPNLFSQTNIQTNGMPEVSARFPGGMEGLQQFINQHLNYPFAVLEANIEGEVYLRFLITQNGSVETPQILSSLHPECDLEALRMISEMPNWIPAQNAGVIVAVEVKMPVYFKRSDVPAEYA